MEKASVGCGTIFSSLIHTCVLSSRRKGGKVEKIMVDSFPHVKKTNPPFQES